VFIMLIFFIVTAVFVKSPGVTVTEPQAVTAKTPGGGSIFVAITSQDQVWIDGHQRDLPSVRGEIERLKSENPEAGVVIQSDENAHNSTLIHVMDAAKAVGINDITIAAKEK
jgi:biopolymer transport protein ExbD